MGTKEMWDRVADIPPAVTIEVGFSEAELGKLRKLAEKRGCSVQTVLRTMASTINLEEPTIYASVEKAPVSHG